MKVSSPDNDAHSQVPVRRKGLLVFNLVNNHKSLKRAEYHVEKRSVLIFWLSYSETNAFVSRVRVDCIAAGARHRRVYLNPHAAPSNAHDIF